jgi:hypothetical protein
MDSSFNEQIVLNGRNEQKKIVTGPTPKTYAKII